MRNTTTLSLGILLAASFSSVANADGKYVPGTYQIDPAHSKVGFEIPHLVISTVEGRFNTFKGEILVDKDFPKSSVQAEVDVASIDTGVKQRDDHLKTGDFFDAQKFPTMAFKSRRIEGTPEAFKLVGDLTMHGVTKEVVFDTRYLGTIADGAGHQKVALDGTAKINRKDFGLTWGKVVEAGPVVGDTVTIVLKIQASRPELKAEVKKDK